MLLGSTAISICLDFKEEIWSCLEIEYLPCLQVRERFLLPVPWNPAVPSTAPQQPGSVRGCAQMPGPGPGPGQHPQLNTPTPINTPVRYQLPQGSPRAPSHTASPRLLLSSPCPASQPSREGMISQDTAHSSVPWQCPQHPPTPSPREQVNPTSAPFDAVPALANTIRGSGRLQFALQLVIGEPRSLPGAKISPQFTSNSLHITWCAWDADVQLHSAHSSRAPPQTLSPILSCKEQN